MTTVAADYYEVTSGPSGSVVTLDEFKLFARIDHNDEDAFLTSLLSISTSLVERYTNRWLLTRTATGFWPEFCYRGYERGRFVEIRKSPLQSVSQVEIYRGGQFVVNTDFNIKNTSTYARLVFNNDFDNYFFVDTYVDAQPYVVRANFTAGYGDANAVPEDLKNAIKIIAMFFWENRGDCECSTGVSASLLPAEARTIMNFYKIIQTFG